ncbi:MULTISPECIES: hypothetical protein [unclassified Rickettsia]|uniref:hypothetical protein n=1 Tax=unclassified Rickettsia TaxID=114295 RepID=UPI0031331F66
MTQPFFNVRTVVGLTTVSRKSLNKKTGFRGRSRLCCMDRIFDVILAKSGALLHGYRNRHCEEAFMPTWQSS